MEDKKDKSIELKQPLATDVPNPAGVPPVEEPENPIPEEAPPLAPEPQPNII